jgi:hypothetical protein
MRQTEALVPRVLRYLSLVVVLAQPWTSIRLSKGVISREQAFQENDYPNESSLEDSCSRSSYEPIPTLFKNETFGACLMVKGDNDLLLEWISYHYTILPLRYLFVASDLGNLEDPRDVLKRWTHAQTALQWWVMNVSVFENMHGEFYDKTEADVRNAIASNQSIDPSVLQEIEHHKLVHKQRAFVSFCANFMKQEEVQWVTFHDSDEFLFVHRVGLDEDSTEKGRNIPSGMNTTEESGNQVLHEKYGLRRYLPPMESNATVVDMIHGIQQNHSPLKSCLTMPRITVGSLETIKCPEAEPVIAFARANFPFEVFNTLRFQQHARKNDFRKNRFGKVFLNIQNISDQSLSQKPLNIHRPFPQECIRPIVDVSKSPFYLMHYLGSWERYSSRADDRRSFDQWKQRASYNDSTACCTEEVHRWLPRFIGQVGLDRAKFLLGNWRTGHDCSTTLLQ